MFGAHECAHVFGLCHALQAVTSTFFERYRRDLERRAALRLQPEAECTEPVSPEEVRACPCAVATPHNKHTHSKKKNPVRSLYAQGWACQKTAARRGAAD